ncbi:MAG: SLC13 family permease [Balneolaceae bacterium]
MGFEAWAVLVIIFLCFALLAFTKISPDVIFLVGLSVIIVGRIVEPAEALTGFSNQGMLTIAALYIVAAGMKETGAIQFVVNRLLGKPGSQFQAQLRLVGPVMTMSAFLNNTPIVASFIPAIQDWAKKYDLPVSRLMIPLSYAAILGGTCTLIGTSTNLIVDGLLFATAGESLNIFEPAYVGIPIAIAGTLYLLFFGRTLLPERKSGFRSFENTREYTIEMMVDVDNSVSLSGKSIEEAGLRHLPGLFLVEIVRDGRIIPAVSPEERLMMDDRLIFTGKVESIVDLQKIAGLSPATDQVFKLDAPRRERVLAEAVVSQSNPLNGSTIREGQFRNRYNAVILAVSRRGERINEKIGDIRLQTGDVLLLEAPANFVEKYRLSNDFYLVSTLSENNTPDYERSWIAWTILGGMVLITAFGLMSMFQAAFLAAVMMILTKCCRISAARDNVDWPVLLVIASALGIGNALFVTGAAEHLAGGLIGLAGSHPLLALATTYLVTWVMTEMITNNAAAVFIFPIAMSTAASLGVSYMPFVMIIIFAASASFSTPIGYQTNLMVYSPGGYDFKDFLKIGLPLNLVVAVIAISLVPVFWPF